MSEAKRPSNNPNGRPAKPPSEKARRITFTLHPRMIETIKAKADAAGVPQSRLIALAVEAYQSGGEQI